MSLNKSKVLRTAEKYVLQGKLPAAIDEYRKVVEADPSDLTTINTLGDLYVRAGRIPDAIVVFSRIAESYRESGFTLKAIAMLKKISKLDPTNIDTAMKLANLYSQQGLLVEARQQYLQVADAYARAGQTRKALEAYQKIADLDPANTSVRMKLGEIYSRERMNDQAHEAFIMAGTEFMRKGDIELALNANLKALTINPESRQALTAIATIYTQQGQPDRAINILCDAFEKNPGDVELLTILGRTYLSAGFMDDAERTFLSLVELDRNRYHYLLEVGRRFLQLGDFDRAAEQIDGCLDVLITKREEDKAIDFLRRVLDKDTYHVGSLKRLSQIFLRIREDHNLIATLNSLVEAALRKGDDKEAISALRELVQLEPDEPMHRQRLYNLGVRDVAETDGTDVVRATGPLDYQSAAFDDAFVIRQISEAEILAGHGQLDHAVEMLTEILKHAPDNVQVHLKLKDIYLRAGIMDKASNECIALARIYDARAESTRANDFLAEAQQIYPLADLPELTNRSSGEILKRAEPSFAVPFAEDPVGPGGGFEVREATGGLDLSRYQTGPLTDQMGFVTLPDSGISAGYDNHAAPNPAADFVFSATGDLPTDTMGSVLRDELEGVDFYIAQGYVEIARDTLDRLRADHGDHSEILSRYKRLGVSLDEELSSPASNPSSMSELEIPASPPGLLITEPRLGAITSELTPPPGLEETPLFDDGEELLVPLGSAPPESEHQNVGPVMVEKQSGPLMADMLVNFNTGELLNDSALDALKPPTGNLPKLALPPLPAPTPNLNTAPPPPSAPSRPLAPPKKSNDDDRLGTAELIESLVSSLDDSFDSIQTTFSDLEPEPVTQPSAFSSFSPAEETKPDATDSELREMIEELKGNTGELSQFKDYETHYSLGLAYKDMDLFDEAIEQFQMAFRLASLEDVESGSIQCCNMLGVCFKAKNLAKPAIMWFQRGLTIPNRSEDEYQALRYDIGLCYEELGDFNQAIEAFMEVYAIDVNYRQVSEKLRELQAAKNA